MVTIPMGFWSNSFLIGNNIVISICIYSFIENTTFWLDWFWSRRFISPYSLYDCFAQDLVLHVANRVLSLLFLAAALTASSAVAPPVISSSSIFASFILACRLQFINMIFHLVSNSRLLCRVQIVPFWGWGTLVCGVCGVGGWWWVVGRVCSDALSCWGRFHFLCLSYFFIWPFRSLCFRKALSQSLRMALHRFIIILFILFEITKSRGFLNFGLQILFWYCWNLLWHFLLFVLFSRLAIVGWDCFFGFDFTIKFLQILEDV